MKIRQILLALAALVAFVGCQKEKQKEASVVSFGSETIEVSAAGDVLTCLLYTSPSPRDRG